WRSQSGISENLAIVPEAWTLMAWVSLASKARTSRSIVLLTWACSVSGFTLSAQPIAIEITIAPWTNHRILNSAPSFRSRDVAALGHARASSAHHTEAQAN